jgi:uncharacterized membrane protein YhaH (DUF805 family)
MASIIISYRRADTGHITGRIFDHLVDHFGRDSVFMDIDAIPIGMDFREHIRTALDKCDIMLAIVGPRWQDGGSPRDRLADETDWMRIELETALAKKIPLVPVLIDQSQLPAPSDLPQTLRDLAFRQTMRIDSGVDFSVHMERLIRSIDRLVVPPPGRGPAPERVPAVQAPASPTRAEPRPPAEPRQTVSQESGPSAGSRFGRLFGFKGRASRLQWWLTMGASVLYAGGTELLTHRQLGIGAFLLIQIPSLYVSAAVGARRAHDRNKPGWRGIVTMGIPATLALSVPFFEEMRTDPFVAFFGAMSAIAAILAAATLGFPQGTKGPNGYGPDPLAKDT